MTPIKSSICPSPTIPCTETDILRLDFAEVCKPWGATYGSPLRNSEEKSSIKMLGYSVQSFQGRMLVWRGKTPPATAGGHSVERKTFGFFPSPQFWFCLNWNNHNNLRIAFT